VALTCPCYLIIALAFTAGAAHQSFLSAIAPPVFLALLGYLLLALMLDLRQAGQGSQPEPTR